MVEFELVLPCYNEGKSLENMLHRASQAALAAGFDSTRFQLILVNNGSTDDSAAVLQKLKEGALGSWFRSVTVPVNQGYGFGLTSGMKETRAPFVAWSHADLQCDPKDAFIALANLKASKKPLGTLVKGVRRGRSLKERFVSRVFEFCSATLLGLSCYEINAQPKVFSRELLKVCSNPPTTFAFDLYILYQAKKLGWTIDTIEVDFAPRVHGFSNWAHGTLRRYKTILGMIRYMRSLALTEGRL